MFLKEIHKQLEKAVSNLDKNFYNGSEDIKTDSQRQAKEEIFKTCKNSQDLFVAYWQNNIRPCKHYNPLTNHRFSGWNVWELEFEMLSNNYNSVQWSTFPQYREDGNMIVKGQHGIQITLAIVSKKKDEESGEEKTKTYYKGYTVFNYEQTEKGGAKASETKQIETKKEDKKETLNTKLLEKWEQQNLFKSPD